MRSIPDSELSPQCGFLQRVRSSQSEKKYKELSRAQRALDYMRADEHAYKTISITSRHTQEDGGSASITGVRIRVSAHMAEQMVTYER